jgi:serine protease
LEIDISGGTGDCDLYVAYGYQPSFYQWDYRPYLHGNNEQVEIDNPQEGEWHIMLNGWNSYGGVILQAYSW